MLRNPVPTGVVIGAFKAQRVRRTLAIVASGSGVPRPGHHVGPASWTSHANRHAGGVDAAARRLGQLRSNAVAGDQRHFVNHVSQCSCTADGHGNRRIYQAQDCQSTGPSEGCAAECSGSQSDLPFRTQQ